MRRFLHVLAIIFSSLFSMAVHGQSSQETVKETKKAREAETSKKAHRHHSHSASAVAHAAPPDPGTEEEPPKKIDPALMASAESDAFPSQADPAVLNAAFPTLASTGGSAITESPVQQSSTDRYPWKRQIVTTTFWIGEKAAKNNPVPNHSSSWDPKWAQNYGGTDDPAKENRSEYMPTGFTPRQNPFYVALPYNDVEKGGHKAEAPFVIPWFRQAFEAPGKSVLKGRWIAIHYKDKVAYAQWEDCGPFRTDHWQYVFGSERPKPNLNHGAGLDVSPAVRDYLGMNGTDVTDWKFVDFDEVPSGPWATTGENNTFVQTRRKAVEQITENRAQRPVTLREY